MIQSGQNVSALGVLGTSCLAIFSCVDPLLPKGEASYNQWAFEIWSLWPYYQEEVLCKGVIQSLKDDATEMVRYLGPAPSVDVILDRLHSL